MVFQIFFSRVVGLPVWWYGRGLSAFFTRLAGSVLNLAGSLSLRVWVKNLFVPMYGDTSFAGRAISFFVRLIMVFVKSIGVVFYTILALLGVVAYAILLPILCVGFLYHLQTFF